LENVVLTVHLIIAALLIGVVLLQRSEGGGLGMGGGSGVMTGRQAANALSRATWVLAAGFLVTSMALFVIAGRNAGAGSVLDRIGVPSAPAPAEPAGNLPALPAYVPPPGAGQPLTPPVPGASPAPAVTPAASPTEAPAATAPATATPAAPAVTPPAAAPASEAAVPEAPGGEPGAAPAEAADTTTPSAPQPASN